MKTTTEKIGLCFEFEIEQDYDVVQTFGQYEDKVATDTRIIFEGVDLITLSPEKFKELILNEIEKCL